MTDYVLSSESTIDLDPSFVDELDISIINANYELNGQVYLDDFGQSLDMKVFYDNMRNGASPSTSRINTNTYVEYFKPILKNGKDIIHLCLSSGMSSQFDSLVQAFELLKEEFPERKMYAVDSVMASAGFGMLTSKLAQLKKEGMDIESLYKWAEDNKRHVINYTSNENLEYVARGGRISKTAATLGGLLHISPLIEVDDTGHMIVTSKIRTRKKLLKTIVDKMAANANDGLDYNDQIYISHADNIEIVDELIELIKDKFKKLDQEIKVSNIGPTIGSHIGPGTLAVFYWGKERMVGYKE
ncbi:DegV family protein [Anaerococcus sp. Marseille-Q7828]|uniref:DegV family protein n=1 Tax=Anaerococcus sp. Marseille-Q7828 TaxID=3036300 RepID=UPI0024ADCC53|nr:DegV family protein [Anaerococcus sp. Marseille-Q7828]